MLLDIAFYTGLAALVFGPFVLGFGPPLVRHLRNRQVLAHGQAAEALVLHREGTGKLLNAQPELSITLEVHPPDAAPFQATIRRFINAVDSAAYAPGSRLAVRCDPASRRVAIVPAP